MDGGNCRLANIFLSVLIEANISAALHRGGTGAFVGSSTPRVGIIHTQRARISAARARKRRDAANLASRTIGNRGGLGCGAVVLSDRYNTNDLRGIDTSATDSRSSRINETADGTVAIERAEWPGSAIDRELHLIVLTCETSADAGARLANHGANQRFKVECGIDTVRLSIFNSVGNADCSIGEADQTGNQGKQKEHNLHGFRRVVKQESD